jgi:hypothetical protein
MLSHFAALSSDNFDSISCNNRFSGTFDTKWSSRRPPIINTPPLFIRRRLARVITIPAAPLLRRFVAALADKAMRLKRYSA